MIELKLQQWQRQMHDKMYLFTGKYQQGNDRLSPQNVTQQVLKLIQGFSGEISRYVACE